MVPRVSLAAEKVIGEKAMQAPLARIAVPRIVAHPISVIANRAASVSCLAQHFMVPGGLLIFGFQPAKAFLPAADYEPHDGRQNLNDGA